MGKRDPNYSKRKFDPLASALLLVALCKVPKEECKKPSPSPPLNTRGTTSRLGRLAFGYLVAVLVFTAFYYGIGRNSLTTPAIASEQARTRLDFQSVLRESLTRQKSPGGEPFPYGVTVSSVDRVSIRISIPLRGVYVVGPEIEHLKCTLTDNVEDHDHICLRCETNSKAKASPSELFDPNATIRGQRPQRTRSNDGFILRTIELQTAIARLHDSAKLRPLELGVGTLLSLSAATMAVGGSESIIPTSWWASLVLAIEKIFGIIFLGVFINRISAIDRRTSLQ